MKEKTRKEDAALRARAEAQVRSAARGSPSPSPHEALKLVHELEVHRVELEMQNEELRHAQGEVESALARYTELFDFAPLGYVVVAADGRVRESNFEAARMLGLVRQQLLGRQFVSLLRDDEHEAFARFFARVMSDVEAADPRELLEVTMRRDGPAPLRVRLHARVMDHGEHRALVALDDVSALKRAEAALRDESHRKDDFIAALSHELRNPLAPIRTSLGVLDRVASGDERAVRARSAIGRQLAHLGSLVDDLLDVSRIATGKIRIAPEPLELRALARETLEELRPGFDEAGLTLRDRLGDEASWTRGDRTRVRQVLANLLSNALKFTPAGGSVEVQLRTDGGRAMLSVRDDGVGISPEVREHLFEPFMQAPQTLERSRGGLGLGLAMVKGLVELHGGAVEAVSAGMGRGATLTIWLPLAAAPELQPEIAPRAPSPVPRKVLVIEDNTDTAAALKDLLELSGHELHVEHNGPSGVNTARRVLPDVVICDLGLPGMSGFEVARALREGEIRPRPFMVALSGYTQKDDRLHALEAGFDRHVAKPPTIEDIEQVMRDAAQSSASGPG